MDNKQKYDNCFMESFGVDHDCLANLAYQEIDAWDSVGHMTLIAAIEDAFNIMMEMDDIIELSSYEKGKEVLAKEEYGIIF